jgi:hypothetical protein
MATINLGRIKPVWKNTWTATTAYVVDDIVRSGRASYICINAHTSAATFAIGSDWQLMSDGGVDGTTVGTGTAGQVLKTNSAGNGTEWGVVTGTPTESGQAGKVLTTDGSTMSWLDNKGATQIWGQTGSFSTVANWTHVASTNITLSEPMANFRDLAFCWSNWANMYVVPVSMALNTNVPSDGNVGPQHMISGYTSHHCYWRCVNSTTLYIEAGSGNGVAQVWGIK